MDVIAADAKLGIPIEKGPYPEGEKGIQQSLQTICKKIRAGAGTAVMKSYASNVIAQAGALHGTTRERAAALLDHTRSKIGYAPDALGHEVIETAETLFCVEGCPVCIRVSDCDGLVVAVGTLAMALGLNVEVVRQYYGGGAQQHVLCEVQLENGSWLPLDPSTNFPAGRKAQALRETRMNPMDGSALGLSASESRGVFVGIGALPVYARGPGGNWMPVDPNMTLGAPRHGGHAAGARGGHGGAVLPHGGHLLVPHGGLPGLHPPRGVRLLRPARLHPPVPIHSHHRPHFRPHHHRRGLTVFFGNGWWWWNGADWIVVEQAFCAGWGDPLAHPPADLYAEAQAQLADSGGNPVTEQWTDGRLYLFEAPASIRPCVATASSYGLGDAPPVYQEVTDKSITAGKRYRLGVLLDFDHEPGFPPSEAEVSNVKSFFGDTFTVESAVALDRAGFAGAAYPTPTWRQGWVVQGVAQTTRTLVDAPGVAYLVVGVQTSGSAAPPGQPQQPQNPATAGGGAAPSDGSGWGYAAGYLALTASILGLGYYAWRKGWIGVGLKEQRA